MTMRAVLYEKFGPPEVLQLVDYPLPQRSSGKVLVKINCTSVNPVDLQMRRGSIPIAKKHKILGGDLAGVVEAAATDSEFNKGDRVFALSPDWSFRSKWGCYAEYATIKSSLLARIPDSISFEQAAALPMVSLTAMQALEAAQVKSGQRVLIHGGSGGVGSAGVQIAKAMGAHVTSTCSTKNMQLVKELGADEVTDYTQTSVDQVFKDNPFDAVLDIVGEKQQYEMEFQMMIQNHMSFPSIVMYVVFNEGWGQYETERVTKYVESLDPSRLYNPASGWVDANVGDLIDMHKYVGPGALYPTSTRASVLGEFGGLGLKVDQHQWIPEDSFSYEMQANSAQLETRYSGLIAQIMALMASPEFSLCAAVYTELTDVEAEVNGMLTYDRQVIKMSLDVTHKVHSELLALSQQLNVGPVTVDQKQLKKAVAAMIAPNKGEKGYVAPPTEMAEQARKAQIPFVAVQQKAQVVESGGKSPLTTTAQYQQPDTFDAATKAAGHKVAGVIHAIWRFLGRSD